MTQELYRVVSDSDAALADLTDLQRAQLRAAVAYHALLHPGRDIEVRVSVGDATQMPATTGPAASEGLDEDVVFTVTVRSKAVGVEAQGSGVVGTHLADENTGGVEGAAPAPVLPEPVVRHVRIGHADATPATTRPPAPLSLPRRAYRALERTSPAALDTVRETVMRRRERSISQPLPRYPDAEGDADIRAALERLPAATEPPEDAQPAAEPPEDAPPAVLFGLHWLQTGGAERWAIESIQAAKDAGFMPVVVTDQNSVHPWLTRPELDGCVVVIMSFDGREPPLDPEIAHAIVQNFRLRGVVIHHSYWLYRALPWIRSWRPEIPIVDSLHIVEYLGGGYPGLAVRFDGFIDRHHTISPELDRWLTEVQGVDPGKLVMAPLTALTVEGSRGFEARDPRRAFTISFVGRLSRQKRPDVFLMLVHHLVKRAVPVRAILHGDGELSELVQGLLDSFRLRDVVEQRLEDAPVAETLAETDLLVVTSINEGLTLTTFEAVAAGAPVLSADVGSQRTIVQGDMLLPRPAREFVRGAEAQIARLAASERAREQAWREQYDRVAEFAKHPEAHHVFKELFAQWQV